MQNKRQLTIVKIGGSIIDNPSELKQFIIEFSKIKEDKILVHGGGKSATKIAQSIGLNPKLIDGRRITDASMLDIVVMVYAGKINKEIVAQLQANKTNAVGLCGADGNTIQSEKRSHTSIDYGFVGDIKNVNTNLINALLSLEITPVFCAITHDGSGQLLNTNADAIASELAIVLAENFEVTLNYCFEKKGVLTNTEDENSVLETINLELYNKLKLENTIHSGMIPKLDNCFHSISQGVKKVKIGHHTMLQDETFLHTKIEL